MFEPFHSHFVQPLPSMVVIPHNEEQPLRLVCRYDSQGDLTAPNRHWTEMVCVQQQHKWGLLLNSMLTTAGKCRAGRVNSHFTFFVSCLLFLNISYPGKPFAISETGAGGIYEWSHNSTDARWTTKCSVNCVDTENNLHVSLQGTKRRSLQLTSMCHWQGRAG